MAEQRINLNTATAEELAQLPGIGPVLAQRIITYRETVDSFDEAAEITAVDGIGARGYQAISDRLMVAPPEEDTPSTADRPAAQAEEISVSEAAPGEEESEVESEAVSEEEAAAEEEAKAEIEAVPPGESFSEEALALEELAPEEEMEGAAPSAEDIAGTAPEEAEPEGQEELADEDVAPEDEEQPTEEEVAPEEEEEKSAEEGLAAALAVPPAEAAPRESWWRRLSWLWTALLGGLLGMIFALIVWAGVNGSLDVGHSRAVLDMRGDLNGLMADVGTLETDVNGLRERLEALEGLTNRMEKVESSVDELREETSQLSEQAELLEAELATVSDELQIISEDVATLQREAERTQSFFSGLQTLLKDVFGESE